MGCVSTYRQGSRPNIAIFAMRRGGSTLLADMLATERGMRMVNEPFLVLEASPEFPLVSRWLPPRLHSTFFAPSPEECERIRAYMNTLLDRRIPIGVCRRPMFPFRADRTLLKILHASALLDWLAESFGLRVVRLLRHPAPQALSVLRAGWGFATEAFYKDPEFLLGFLSDEQVELGRRILAGPSRWRLAILDWCIHYHLLVRASRLPSTLLTYETLVLDLDASCRMLCDRLELSDCARITARALRPSSSPGGVPTDKVSLIRTGDFSALVRQWRRQVDATMAAQAQEILDRFDVSIYEMGSALPVRTLVEIAAEGEGGEASEIVAGRGGDLQRLAGVTVGIGAGVLQIG